MSGSSVITKYCFDVAQAFNEFYNKHQILGVEKEVEIARLALSSLVRDALKNALGLLTIGVVEEM
jgi:arginyl-tRNA synthetase